MMIAATIARGSPLRTLPAAQNRIQRLRNSAFTPSRRPFLAPPAFSAPSRSLSSSTEISANLKAGQKLDDYPEYFTKRTASSGPAVSLSSFKGRRPVVLFFYPKAGTPGCTKQAQTFRDQYNELKALGAAVFGISGDTLEEQKTFASAQNLPYPLLVDEGDALRKGFGIKSDLFGALPGRQTIVIDKSGKCILSYNNQFSPETHANEAIKALQTA